MSEFKFSCPHCKQKMQATHEYSGAQINCPACQKPIVVPQAPGMAAAQPAAPASAPAASAPPPPPAAAMSQGRLSKAPSPVQHAATSPVVASAAVRQARKKSRMGLYIALGSAAVVAAAAILFVPKMIDKYNEQKEAKAKAEEAAKAPPPPPPEPGADEIEKKLEQTYDAMTSYSAQATTTAKLDLSAVSPMFKDPITTSSRVSILLAKPDRYRIEWDAQIGPQSSKGAIWSTGKGDYVRTTSTPVKVKNRQAAFAALQATLSSLSWITAQGFLDVTNKTPDKLGDFVKTNGATVNGHKCYVLTAAKDKASVKFYVRKDDYMVVRLELALGGKVEESDLAGLTPAQRKMAEAGLKVKGTITETYDNIETNKTLTAEAFAQPSPPSGAMPAAAPGMGSPPNNPTLRTRGGMMRRQ